MEYLLLVLAALTSSFKGLICKKIGTDNSNGRRIYIFNAGIFFVASVTVLLYSLISRGLGSVSLRTLLLALTFAAVLLFTQLTETYAMKLGPASVTILIYSLGLVLPILYGRIFLSEKISLIQLFGMAFVVAALVFIIDPKKDKSFSLKWFVFATLAALGSGTTALIQKIHQSSEAKGELCVFLVISFVFAAVFSVAIAFFSRGGEGRLKFGASDLRFTLFSGACIGALNIMNLYLAGKLPAIIQFPIYNIGSMILTGVGGRIFFGERMSKKKLIGFLAGCAAILMIGLG